VDRVALIDAFFAAIKSRTDYPSAGAAWETAALNSFFNGWVTMARMTLKFHG
jgi:hypothetical protein